MSDHNDEKPQRRPFGERGGGDDHDPAPFGAYRRGGRPRRPEGPRPTDPYERPRPPREEPAEPEPDNLIESVPERREEPPSAIDEVAASIQVDVPDFYAEPDPPPYDDTTSDDPQPDPAPPLEPLLQRQEPVPLRFGVMLQTIGVMLLSGLVVATMFTWWTPTAFLPAASVAQLAVAQATQVGPDPTALPPESAPVVAPTTAPTATTAPINNIGIVSGHAGIYPPTGQPDPGAVCPDGLTEREINAAVADIVVVSLTERGYTVDLLEEFDARLQGYRGLALVSIHADTCTDLGPGATGYKVASFAYSTKPTEDARLVRCLSQEYEAATGLPFHPSITFDMTEYHTFREIDPATPGAIIEIGFMLQDRAILTQQPDVVARGVVNGILCYIEGEGDPGGEGAS